MKTYSGAGCLQDVFALFVNSNIENGFVVDIGCKTPGNGNNSTLFLENKWNGVGADIHDYSHQWEIYPNFQFHKMDVTLKNNIDLLFSKCPNVVEFLSLDVDEAGLVTLQNIDLDAFKFKCICIEHDYYRFGESLRHSQRKILEQKYTRVIQTQAEDWYVDYSLIDKRTLDVLKSIPNHSELYGDEMYKILNWLSIN
jgi:hypothetical protein